MTHVKSRGMNRAAVRKAIADALLPLQVKEYLSAFADSGADSEFRRALKADPARLLADISRLIDRAAAVTGILREAVLFATGFHPGNLAPVRLEAALAELRAADFLAGESFSAVCLVPGARGKTADITASRGGNTYAFEVRCVTGFRGSAPASFFDKEGRLRPAGEKAVALLVKKYRKKMPQAAVSKKKAGLSHCGLVLVTSINDFSPFNETNGMKTLAKAVYERTGSRPGEHICLLAGGQAAVFPDWQQE